MELKLENQFVIIVEDIPVGHFLNRFLADGIHGTVLVVLCYFGNFIELVLENLPEPSRNFDIDCGNPQDFVRGLFRISSEVPCRILSSYTPNISQEVPCEILPGIIFVIPTGIPYGIL